MVPSLFVPLQQSDWFYELKGWLETREAEMLSSFVEEEYRRGPVYPQRQNLFTAFEETPYAKVRIVIVGQDPYHQKGQAHGLCFSVPPGITYPPSLQNIFKELKDDLGISPSSGCLLPWARQGVFLLNTSLTVREGTPLSHQRRGWEAFTDYVVLRLAERRDPLVFVLWGSASQAKCAFLLHKTSPHLILTAAHPSPLSSWRGFFGCRHFSKVNQFLLFSGKKAVDWHF